MARPYISFSISQTVQHCKLGRPHIGQTAFDVVLSTHYVHHRSHSRKKAAINNNLLTDRI